MPNWRGIKTHPLNNDAPALANRQWSYDGPEQGRHGATCPDKASDQILKQLDINKPEIFDDD